jgi:hypothetical protein
MAFRDLIADIDDTVFAVLGDSAQIEGRPVAGMFCAPWLQPVVGRLNTGLREPHFVMRVTEAQGVDQGQVFNIDLPGMDGGGTYTIARLEPDGTGLVSLVLRMKS